MKVPRVPVLGRPAGGREVASPGDRRAGSAGPARWGERAPDVALVATALAGCLARVAGWAAPRSYSHDEISLLFSLRTLPVGTLLGGPLLLDQGAPVLWLAVERAVLAAFGHGERTMRAFPMLLTCVSVVLVALLARQVLSRPAAVVATALFAVAPLAVFYAWQVKPYGADMAAAAGLLLLAVGLVRRPRWEWRHGLTWWAAATVAAGFSFPSLLLVAGVAVALVAARLLAPPGAATDVQTRVGQCARFAAPAPLWLGAVAAVYVLKVRHLTGLQDDYPMWASGYRPPGVGAARQLQWVHDVHASLVELVWLAPVTWPALLLAVLGAGSLWYRDRAAFLVVTAAPAVAFIAALVRFYPEKGRLALWVVPALVLLVAHPVWPWRPGRPTGARAGADSGHDPGGRPPSDADGSGRGGRADRVIASAAACALLATVLLPGARATAFIVASPERYDLALRAQGTDITPLLDVVRRQGRPADRLVAQDAYFHKALWYGHPRGLRVDGVLAAGSVGGDCEVHAYREAAGDARRLWFIGGESWLVTSPPFPDVALAHLRTLGHVTTVTRQHTATLYAVDLTAPPDARTAPASDRPPCAHFRTWPNPLR